MSFSRMSFKYARVTPMLIGMAGLPGAGKSSIAEKLGQALPAPVISVDPIEAAIWRAGVPHDQPTGYAAYLVAEAVADGILGLGQNAIVDAVNAVEPARWQWRSLAQKRNTPLTFIEVVCSDPDLHRQRLESRSRGIPGFKEPTWEMVQRQRAEFEPFPAPHENQHPTAHLLLDSTADLTSNVTKALGLLALTHPAPSQQRY
jgi:predicted kinase